MEETLYGTVPAARGRSGQAIIELAFVLPIVMLLLLGAADVGRAFYEAIVIQNAAEAGSLAAVDFARDANVGTGNAAVKSVIKSSTNPDVFPFIQIQDADITLDIQWSPDTPYTITVTRNFHLITPFAGRLFGGGQNLPLRAVVQGRQNCSISC